MRAAQRLREALAAPGIVVMPCCFDGLSAKLIADAGTRVSFMSGFAASAARLGLPDTGLISFGEMVDSVRNCCAAAPDMPIIADGDTGYGNALNVQRTVRELERAGVAALHLEDQVFPKRCGHYDGKAVVPAAEMVQKLRAARDGAQDADLVIIARTDAIAVEGLDAAIERAHAYAAAGADVLFVEAPTSEAQIETIARSLPGPKLINMFEGGKTPLVPLARLQALGYRVVIVPSDLQRAAIRAMQEVLAVMRRDGNSRALADRMATFDEREAVVRTREYLDRDRRYGA